MVNESGWARLSEAIKRVMNAAECSKEEAQAYICRAVADRAVEIRAQLKKHTTMKSNSVLAGSTLEIPPTIRPEDLDWDQSRPLRPWVVNYWRLPGSWNLEWIELSRTDIASVWCAARDRGDAAQPTASAKQPKAKSQPKAEAARLAIQELFPDGPPDQVALSNKELVWQVGEKLKELGLPKVKPDTIFRAAGRRRK